MPLRRLVVRCVALAAVSCLAVFSSTDAVAADDWGPLQDAGGGTLAVALDDQTTVLVSVGGADDATVYDQRRRADGTAGPLTPVTSVKGVSSCRPVAAVTALSNLAVAVECRQQTGLEEPPTVLVELVWTGDDGWVSRVVREGRLGSLDYSPGGQYALFTSNSDYGRPHHLTTYHADLGWRDLRRRELGSSGDDLVAAVDDGGNLVALRGAGFEDEPGYWFGGRLALETYGATSGRWRQRFSHDYPDGGIDPQAIDVAGGRLVASAVRSRSTGRLDGRDDKPVVLTGSVRDPRLWSPRRWSRGVLTATAATTRSGSGVVAWQAVAERRTVESRVATWAPRRHRPSVATLPGTTTLTTAAESGHALDLSASADGHGVLAWVARQGGAAASTVTATSFDLAPRGGLEGQVAMAWQQPVETTVDVTASATATSVTLGTVNSFAVPSPLTRYGVGP